MRKRIFVFTVPILILFFITISPLLTLTKGTEILLETTPVDPSDIFRGDYITLNYEISQVDKSKLDSSLKKDFDWDNIYQAKVYVTLEQGQDGYFKVKSISPDKPDTDIYLTAKLSAYRLYEEPKPGEEDSFDYKNAKFEYQYHIVYDIDKFFVPENSGKEYEKASLDGDIIAIIKVYKGNSLIKNIKIK